MHFSYDPLILKEHKRRLKIKNAHLEYELINSINVDNIIKSFQKNIKKEIKQEKRKLNNFILKRTKDGIRSKSQENRKLKEIPKKEKRNSVVVCIKPKFELNRTVTLTDEFINRKSISMLNKNKLDFSLISPNDINFLNISFNQENSSNTSLRSERNNLLSGILNIETNVKSSQIKFTDIDKSTFRKINN
jgi:hypothetical protein